MEIPCEVLKDKIKGGKMYYIYCYINKINNHKYVGQTNNLKRRIREHKSCAFNPKSLSYNHLIHKKIRQYGLNNFEVIVLEKIDTEDICLVNKREEYWIEKQESFRGTGKGYNSTTRSENFIRSSVLTKDQLKELKADIILGMSYKDLQKKYSIGASFISNINNGKYFNDYKTQYPLFKYYKTDNDYKELIELLLNSTLTLSDIAKKLGMGYSTVKKINAGTLRKGLYPHYPIRKKSAYEIRADRIKKLLTSTDLTYKEIANKIKVSKETVRRINLGNSFKDETIQYPLRNV